MTKERLCKATQYGSRKGFGAFAYKFVLLWEGRPVYVVSTIGHKKEFRLTTKQFGKTFKEIQNN
jgi:hypothetical protein